MTTKSRSKYLLIVPQGGVVDCLSRIGYAINACKSSDRILLLDMTNSDYRINFSDYFFLKDDGLNIIYDSKEIKKIVKNEKLTVYPNNLNFRLIELFNQKRLRWFGQVKLNYNALPEQTEDIVFTSTYGGGQNNLFLNNIFLKENIKNICKEKMALLKNDYLCIQARNTDKKCDFEKLYEDNVEYINSFNEIYIATDCEQVLNYFKSKHSNVYCFTTFPEISDPYILSKKYSGKARDGWGLHRENGVSYDTKLKDLIVDIFIATNSKKILSNSKGGFIRFLRRCHHNKKTILEKL